MTEHPQPAALRVGMVPGVMPDKWVRRWRDRQRRPLELVNLDEDAQLAALDDGDVHLCFVRAHSRTDEHHVIPLYDEVQVVVLPEDHVLTLIESVSAADLDGELVLPQSVARLRHGRDRTYRPVHDLPPIPVGLAWRTDATDPDIDTFIGIVRGRTERSSRG